MNLLQNVNKSLVLSKTAKTLLNSLIEREVNFLSKNTTQRRQPEIHTSQSINCQRSLLWPALNVEIVIYGIVNTQSLLAYM